MALFARELRYAAYDMGDYLYFIALVMLAKRKGSKKPVKLVLYRHMLRRDDPERNSSKMIRIPLDDVDACVEVCWPKNYEEVRQEVEYGDSRWKRTTRWLCPLVVDGWYEPHLRNTWVKVSEPKHRKTQPLSDFEARAKQKRIKKAKHLLELNVKRNLLWKKRQSLVGCAEHDKERSILSKRILRLERMAISVSMWRSTEPKFEQPFRRICMQGRQLVLV